MENTTSIELSGSNETKLVSVEYRTTRKKKKIFLIKEYPDDNPKPYGKAIVNQKNHVYLKLPEKVINYGNLEKLVKKMARIQENTTS